VAQCTTNKLLKLRISQPTRSFAFARVNPRESDYALLVNSSSNADAHMGHRTIRDDEDGRTRLVGFLALRGPPAFPCKLCPHFPNFLISRLQGQPEWDDLKKTYDSVHGEHPFRDLRKKLQFSLQKICFSYECLCHLLRIYLVFFSEAVNATAAPTKGMTVLSKGKGKKKKEYESKKMKMKMKGMIQVITTNEQ